MRRAITSRRGQAGFTLAELAVVVVVVGILGTLIGSYFDVASYYNRSNYVMSQSRINRAMAAAMARWAERYNGARLPTPYTAAGADPLRSAPFNVEDLVSGDAATANRANALLQMIQDGGVQREEVNTDGYATELLRVFQRVGGLTVTMPIFGLAGNQALLTYEFGVIYNTRCSRFDAGCNPNAATGLPGASAVLTAANVNTWVTAGDDFGAIRFSTLDLQRRLLDLSGYRVNSIRDELRDFFNSRLIQAPPGDATNFFPGPNGPGAPTLAGQNPVANQGCHDGWYDLSAANVNVLDQLGLGQAEFGVTAWGGAIQYCRDYEPSAPNATTAGTLPHNGAVRLHRSVSQALAPGLPGDNLVFSF